MGVSLRIILNVWHRFFCECFMKCKIVIPARLASTRLPRKMMADICGTPLIVRTYKSALEANVGDVFVACDSEEIASLIRDNGGQAILTDPDLPSGTDRVYAAASTIDCNDDDIIVNVQGDLPFVDPVFIRDSYELCCNDGVDIATPITRINDESYKLDSVVKPAVTFYSDRHALAHYFSRSIIPFGGPYYHHVGVYAYKLGVLKRFVKLNVSELEKSERLEQLRALENGMRIHAVLCDIKEPISIDTAQDLQKAIDFVSSR